ncbi:MAG: hypothetical protein E6001_00800 [Haemophilus parainfluenzae]|nr:hypothetical protein HMPREF9417_0269 [Haemophilus parainfluenzae ATCC 33392]MBF1222139.1 hypothetical protein [Haemophilus influenzae]MDU5695581.1 hypothetical protein [Haemophilus parainfluenzae]MED9963276.1 hypothetical protein [Haemophilus parainfluenzae]
MEAVARKMAKVKLTKQATYRKYLANRQYEIRAEVLVAIEKFGVNK